MVSLLHRATINKSTRSPIKRNVQQHKMNTKKLKPGLIASYDIPPANVQDLYWFRCFKNLSLTYLLRHLLTAPRPTFPYCRCQFYKDTTVV